MVNGTWQTQRIEHLYLEPESALAEPCTDGFRLYTQGQGIFDDRRQVAGVLGIPEDQLDVELVPNGGAFGGKEDMSVQAQTALLAQATGRPVKLTLTREESIRIHPKRHPITHALHRRAATRDGRLTAVRARMIGDSGAYASVGGKVLERAAGHACGPYARPAVDIEALAVYTNNPPCGAMRGFGANQAHFAIEGCHRSAGGEGRARRLGDALAQRARGRRSVLDRPGARKVGRHQEDAPGREGGLLRREARGRAVGIACGIKNSGIGNGAMEWGKARLVVERDGTITLYNGYTEMGQGLLTVLTQFAAEVTGLPAAQSSARRWTRPTRSAAARRPARGPRSSAGARS